MCSSVFSCGANSWGQLGLGHTDDRNEPCLVEMLRNVAVQQLDCGAAHTMVVCDGKRVPAVKAAGQVAPPPIDDMDVDVERLEEELQRANLSSDVLSGREGVSCALRTHEIPVKDL